MGELKVVDWKKTSPSAEWQNRLIKRDHVLLMPRLQCLALLVLRCSLLFSVGLARSRERLVRLAGDLSPE
jgi:hypothetical protein